MRKVIVLICLIGLAALPAAAQDGTKSAHVFDANRLNMREGPGVAYDIVAVLEPGAPVTLEARAADRIGSTWVQIRAGGAVGWVNSRYLVLGEGVSVEDLPFATTGPGAYVPTGDTAGPQNPVIPAVGAHAREIFLRGQELGNRAGVFTKVGDCMTDSPHFLYPIGRSVYVLGEYDYLQSVIAHFFTTPTRPDWPHNSFNSPALTSVSGFTSVHILDPDWADPNLCAESESPLECEYRIVKPAVALIMLGTNDSWAITPDGFGVNLAQIVEISIEYGVIPVLATVPDDMTTAASLANTQRINWIIARTAAKYDVPLLNFWKALQDLPDRGLDPDHVHLSEPENAADFTQIDHGWTLRNLTALQALDAVWRGAMQ